VHLVRYTLVNDCSDQCTTGAQPALSLRLGPQIQTLLSREGRPTGGRRTGPSRGRHGCSIVRGGHVDSHTSTKASNAPALEGDHLSWLRPAHADATQGRWQLSEATRRIRSRFSRWRRRWPVICRRAGRQRWIRSRLWRPSNGQAGRLMRDNRGCAHQVRPPSGGISQRGERHDDDPPARWQTSLNDEVCP